MKRSGALIIGVVLAVLGVAGLVVRSISYRDDETRIEIGPIEATAATRKTVTIPKMAAGGVLALGVGLIAFAVAKKG